MRLLPIFLPLCFQGDFFPLFFMAQAYPFSFPFVAIFTSVCHNKSIQGKMVGCIFLESPQASSRPKLGQKLFLFKDDAHFSQSWEHDGKSGKWPFPLKYFRPKMDIVWTENLGVFQDFGSVPERHFERKLHIFCAEIY